MAAQNNILLIGFMGSGKSTVAKILATRTGKMIIDLDRLIEEKAGRPIPAIFADSGESCFRDLETEALRNIQHRAGLVIATGGGIVMKEENWHLMQRMGRVVFLQTDWQTIHNRLACTTGRPLADGRGMEEIRELFIRRQPIYRQADLIIDCLELSPEAVADKILEQIDHD
jgi:shikimate kinase